MGLQLGHEAIPGAAAEKVKGLVQPLIQNAELLGFASLGLGILHLFLASVVLPWTAERDCGAACPRKPLAMLKRRHLAADAAGLHQTIGKAGSQALGERVDLCPAGLFCFAEQFR